MRVVVIVGLMIVTTGFYLRFLLALMGDSKSRSDRSHFASKVRPVCKPPRSSDKAIEIRPSVPGYCSTFASPPLPAVDGRSASERMTRLPKSS